MILSTKFYDEPTINHPPTKKEEQKNQQNKMETQTVNTKNQSKSINNNALWIGIPATLMVILLTILILKNYQDFSLQAIQDGFNQDLLFYFLIGIFAQLVDGALGMGYGATSTSFLLALGVPPAVSSTGVHVSEMFTTGASAISHFKFGNINKKLVKHLLIPGVIGSVIGAYLLADIINGDAIKPYISAYMIILAIIIIKKALKRNTVKQKTKRLGILATFGGFMDSIGGGGWGPIVTSTLLGRGRNPKYTIGSVNTAEFAVSFASGITFLYFGSVNSWQVIAGLILGGIIAAPIAAFLVNKIKRKPMMIMVGVLIICLSLRTLAKYF